MGTSPVRSNKMVKGHSGDLVRDVLGTSICRLGHHILWLNKLSRRQSVKNVDLIALCLLKCAIFKTAQTPK